LGALDHLRHSLSDRTRLHTGSRHHGRENVAIEHSSHWHAFSGGFEANSTTDSIDESLAMVRPSPPDEGSIDIEQYECVYLFQLLL
jgi:hypothetical protein